MKEHFNKLVSVLIVLVVLILLYIGSVILKKNTTSEAPATQTQPQAEQNSAASEPSESTPQVSFSYDYVANYKESGGYTEQNYDGKIIRTNTETNEVTTMIPSVKQAYPKLKEYKNLSLQNLNRSEKTGNLYLTTVLMESDGGRNGIVKYDPKTNKLTELKISDYFRIYSARESANSPFAASILTPAENMDTKDPKKLYLLDLDNDTVKTLTTLPKGQTFNYCYIGGCMFGVMPEIKWLSAEEFEVTVFSTTQTEKDGYGNDMSKRLKKLKFNVNQ
ncbi:hypothetical protein IPM19_02690 [bacterium]|nr:MAG: hypothetical protein IPM19_02690 [bacterium]